MLTKRKITPQPLPPPPKLLLLETIVNKISSVPWWRYVPFVIYLLLVQYQL